jgi:hypothetical protein
MDTEILEMLLRDLEGSSALEVISDRLTNVGDNIDKLMSEIMTCHAVIILGTPAYKQRVVQRSNILYQEYNIILNALELYRSRVCPQIWDSFAWSRMIHRRSTDSGVDHAPVCTS